MKVILELPSVTTLTAMKFYLNSFAESVDDREMKSILLQTATMMEYAKPLTLCQDCKKWKTIECSKTKMLADIVRNSLTKYAKLVWPDHDDFCKDGEPKEIV